jgi:hypothetical protein
MRRLAKQTSTPFSEQLSPLLPVLLSRVAASDLEFFRRHSVDFAKIDQKERWLAHSVYRHTMTRGLS